MPDLSQFQHDFGSTVINAVEGAIAVYRNTALTGAVDALCANYPVVAKIVGSTMFEAIAVDFAGFSPPESPVLAMYGRGFADWIEDQKWAAELPYLAEVARFERLFIESLFAADAEPLTLTMLTNIAPANWESHRLDLHPAVRFGWATCPAMTLWLGHQTEDPRELAPEWKAEGGLFTRPDQSVRPYLLDAPAHRFLFGIRLGEGVGTAAARTTSLYPEASPGGLLTSLVNAGAFAAPHNHQN